MEWPTWALFLTIHGGWIALTRAWGGVPPVLLPLLGGWLVAWHGSLQHELVHGHPTRSARVNAALGSLPIGLWLPSPLYQRLHLAHHRTRDLTLPRGDTESFYVTPERWARMSAPARALAFAHATLLGRMVLGPPFLVGAFVAGEVHVVARGDRSRLRIWAVHLLGCAAVIAWLVLVCRMPLWVYLAAFLYPGLSLALVRSFVEHRPARERAHRSAIVESRGPLAWLFLHNNLHAVHHAAPRMPWYRLPAFYRAHRDQVLADNGGYRFSGYGAIALRYALRPHDHPAYRAEAPTEAHGSIKAST